MLMPCSGVLFCRRAHSVLQRVQALVGVAGPVETVRRQVARRTLTYTRGHPGQCAQLHLLERRLFAVSVPVPSSSSKLDWKGGSTASTHVLQRR